MTSRASAAVGATRAMRRTLLDSAWARTHSAPVRVLPQPRPARTSQTSQSPSGGTWEGRAQVGQSHSRASAAPGSSLRYHALPQAGLRCYRLRAGARLLHPHPSSVLTFLGGRRVWSAGRRNARRSTRRRWCRSGQARRLSPRRPPQRVGPARLQPPADASRATPPPGPVQPGGPFRAAVCAFCAVGGHPAAHGTVDGVYPHSGREAGGAPKATAERAEAVIHNTSRREQ